MSYKDTLKLYDELIAGGCTEAQARVQAEQLGSVGTVLDQFKSDIKDFKTDMDNRFNGLEKDLFWMRVIGGAMAFAFLGSWFR